MRKTRLMPSDLQWSWSMPVPTSQGWLVDSASGLVFTGLQFPIGSDGELVGPNDIEAQTHTVFSNLTRVLQRGGVQWSDVVKMNTFYVFEGAGDELTNYWERLTRVRVRFYANPAHCGTGVRVVGLPGRGVLIAAAAIAAVGDPTGD